MLFAANYMYYCTSVSLGCSAAAAALVAHLCSNLLSFALKRHRLSKCRHKTWIHTQHTHPHTHWEGCGKGRDRGRGRDLSAHMQRWLSALGYGYGFGLVSAFGLGQESGLGPSYMLALALMSKSGQHMSHAQQAADIAMWLTRLRLHLRSCLWLCLCPSNCNCIFRHNHPRN